MVYYMLPIDGATYNTPFFPFAVLKALTHSFLFDVKHQRTITMHLCGLEMERERERVNRKELIDPNTYFLLQSFLL